MANYNINKSKALSKWTPVLENMGIKDQTKKEWMAEYAEYHSLKENVAYANLGNLTGMGAVAPSTPSAIPGQTYLGTGVAGQSFGVDGKIGSGDYGQQLLPVAMKIAAHTIGLDLVAVKPSAGPSIDLMFVDTRYDDALPDSDNPNYVPVVFKIGGTDTAGIDQINILTTQLRSEMVAAGVKELRGAISNRMFYNLPANSSGAVTAVTTSAYTGQNSTTRAKGSIGAGVLDVLTEPTGSKEGVIEFLGFSTIDKLPMFRAYRTTNAQPQGAWVFDRTKNTFGEVESVLDAFKLDNGSNQPLNTTDNTIGFSGPTTSGQFRIELISTAEDNITGFVSNGLNTGMPRSMDGKTYPGIIAPNVTTQKVQVGSIEVTSALELNEIEDIKSQTGIDIVAKLESVLVDQLSQHISKEIVLKVFEMGDINRQSAPGYNPAAVNGGTTIFDFNVDTYFTSGAPGGETSQSLQAQLLTKVRKASNYIATDGRVGPGTFIVTNGGLASILMQASKYTLSPSDASQNAPGQLYPMGKIEGMTLYVDPYMNYSDNRILVGRKNNVDQPGVIFVPYLMAQSINLISEATFAPRMLLRSRYAVTQVGFFPQKQYITIYVTDANSRLG